MVTLIIMISVAYFVVTTQIHWVKPTHTDSVIPVWQQQQHITTNSEKHLYKQLVSSCINFAVYNNIFTVTRATDMMWNAFHSQYLVWWLRFCFCSTVWETMIKMWPRSASSPTESTTPSPPGTHTLPSVPTRSTSALTPSARTASEDLGFCVCNLIHAFIIREQCNRCSLSDQTLRVWSHFGFFGYWVLKTNRNTNKSLYI